MTVKNMFNATHGDYDLTVVELSENRVKIEAGQTWKQSIWITWQEVPALIELLQLAQAHREAIK